MNCLPAKKRKRKSQNNVTLTGINKRWNSVDISDDVIFTNDMNMDGFMGLEELNDYDENEILALSNASKKKKKKKEDIEEEGNDDHADASENVIANENVDPLEDHRNEDEDKVNSNASKKKKKKRMKEGIEEEGNEECASHHADSSENVVVNENIDPLEDHHNEDEVKVNSNASKKKKKKKKVREQCTELSAINLDDVISNENTVPSLDANDIMTSNTVPSLDDTKEDTDILPKKKKRKLEKSWSKKIDLDNINIDEKFNGNLGSIIENGESMVDVSNDGQNCSNDGLSKEGSNDKQPKKEGSVDEQPKEVKLSKKERRKQARKLSFKLKLKERRKKFKEMKRLNKASEVNKSSEELTVDQIADTVIDRCESFEIKSHVRTEMNDWLGLGVPDEVLKALCDSNFTSPTPIQRQFLPQAILYRQDIIGAAETGSGKTLAFGIPLIKSILDLKSRPKKDDDNEEESPLYALIISPTRELAIQISDHIQLAAKYTGIQCVAIVGGLSTAKQERLISKCPEIVVGTPGRLHKLLLDGCDHLNKFETLKHLVIDEADRMLEQGHFKELNDILEMINRVKVKRQIFVLSATLTLPQHHNSYKKKKDKKTEESETQMFIDTIGINPKAKVIDLTPKHVTATQLQQLRVMCSDDEKDLYLVYFLMEHPGRSIIFVNSISCTRRLTSLLALLGFTPSQLHSGKQQKQRLKYLDRFTASENGLLIATDVAARGLDIPKVSNVIHYQLPNDPKIYVHRAGRTARANETGISFILEGPEDFPALKKISSVLKLGKDIPSMRYDQKIIEGIKARVVLAREIDKEEYKVRKQNADDTWMKQTADSMEIETDEVEEGNNLTKREKLRHNAKRKQLQKLLSQNLYPSGFSGSFPTKSGNLIIPSIPMQRGK